MASGSESIEKLPPLRLGNISPLSPKMLPPIEGYENFPIVTLEEAIKPLISIVPNIERNVFLVKKNCERPEDGLTPDESAAIMLYTLESYPHQDSLYFILNSILRSETREKLVPWFLYLRLILSGLSRLPSKSCHVYRGVKENLSAEYPTDKTFIWWGFSSCTAKIDILNSQLFFGTSGERTLFNIDCFSAKDIKKHSFISSEEELLLLPAREFKVSSSLYIGSGLHIVQLEEQKLKYDLVAQVSVPKLLTPTESLSPSSSEIPNPPVAARWQQNGITVAGGHGIGRENNQLNYPLGLFVDNDDDQTIVIADQCNHRIIQCKRGNTDGKIVAGGKDQGHQLDQLNRPSDVLIDKKTDSLIIADGRRVVRWSRRYDIKQGEVLVDNIDSWGFAMSEDGKLFVADTRNFGVKRYNIRRGEKNGSLAAGGNGEGDGLNQFNDAYYIFVDREKSLYVSDNRNHRVMRWDKGAKQGIVIAGGLGVGDSLANLSYPNGIFVDASRTLYVAEGGNHRVTCWPQGSKKGILVVGGNGQGGDPNQLNVPRGLAFDKHKNLYVVDCLNHRVQRFDVIK